MKDKYFRRRNRSSRPVRCPYTMIRGSYVEYEISKTNQFMVGGASGFWGRVVRIENQKCIEQYPQKHTVCIATYRMIAVYRGITLKI